MLLSGIAKMSHRIQKALVGMLLMGSMACGVCFGATLEQLSEQRLIEESTEIVRGTVLFCQQTYRQPVIWTICDVTVTERFKGGAGNRVQVAIPGGTAGGFRQNFEGTPNLERNGEYLFFLWQGKSGLKQIMGLSQGLLNVVRDERGSLVLVRGKIEEQMVDAAGRAVEDGGLKMPLEQMRREIAGRTGKSRGVKQ
jgi:hypothetical protein